MLKTITPQDIPIAAEQWQALTHDDESLPWYGAALVGIGAWCVALLLVGLIVSFFAFIGVDDPQIVAVIGAIGLVIAARWYGQSRHPFYRQLATVLALASQAALAGGLGVDCKSVWMAALIWGCATFGVMPFIRDRAHGFIGALVGYALIAIAFYADKIGLGSLNILVPIAGFISLWALWRPGRTWSGQAAAFALLIAMAFHACWEPLTMRHGNWIPASVAPAWWQQGAWFAKISLIAMIGFCLYDQRQRLGTAKGLVLGLLAIFLGVILPPAGGVALLMLAIGYALAAVPLVVIGVLFELYALGQFYHDLDLSLLDKSFLLAGAGVGLLLVWGWLYHFASKATNAESVPNIARVRFWQIGLVVASIGLTAVTVVPDIVAWETLRRDGATILLRLRPVDPRSLIQGDYMALDFDRSALPPDNNSDASMIVVTLDVKRVAMFQRFADQTPLKENEWLLPIHNHSGNAQFPFTSFFFEEGQATKFESARFAILHVDKKGRAVLSGLADADHRPITP
jgi:uncharacterized membrane-anchored protein